MDLGNGRLQDGETLEWALKEEPRATLPALKVCFTGMLRGFLGMLRESKQLWGLPWWLSGKELVCSAGDAGSIPGLGRSPGGGNATHSSILAWRILRTVEPGGLQFVGSQSQK